MQKVDQVAWASKVESNSQIWGPPSKHLNHSSYGPVSSGMVSLRSSPKKMVPAVN